jgi:hypothetical protein
MLLPRAQEEKAASQKGNYPLKQYFQVLNATMCQPYDSRMHYSTRHIMMIAAESPTQHIPILERIKTFGVVAAMSPQSINRRGKGSKCMSYPELIPTGSLTHTLTLTSRRVPTERGG